MRRDRRNEIDIYLIQFISFCVAEEIVIVLDIR